MADPADPNLQICKGAVLLNKDMVSARDWKEYLIKNMQDLIDHLQDATIVILAGRHGQESGAIGGVESYVNEDGEKKNLVMYNHERLVEVVSDSAKADFEARRIMIELINVDDFYDKDELDNKGLQEKIEVLSPSIVLISICYSQKLELRFVLEMKGIFPKLRLQGDLRKVTNGKEIALDPVQELLLYTMADEENIEKTTVLHGPEGSGKTLLALEIAKMKLIHYMKKLNLQASEAKKKIRLIVCGFYTGEDRVPLLLKQLKDEANDIEDFCKVELKPVQLHDLQMVSPALLEEELKVILDLDNKKFVQSIVMMDELYPAFATERWMEFKGLANTDYVLALRHAFNDGVYSCLTWWNWAFQKEKDIQDIMEEQGVKVRETTVFCHLRKSYRCTQEILSLTYYMMMHAPPEEELYKQKSFFHLPQSHSGSEGQKPLWLQVPSIEALIHYSDNNDRLKLETNVMIISDQTFDSQIIYTLRGYAKKRNWRVCSSTSVMGSEASTVIIFNMKTIHFEALSRAILQLIFVTTDKEETTLTRVLKGILDKKHDNETCKANCYQNRKIFRQSPLCQYYNNSPAFDDLLVHDEYHQYGTPHDATTSVVTSPIVLKFLSKFVQWEDLNDDLENEVRKQEDVVELEQPLGELGWSIIEEKLSISEFVDLDSIIEQFCKLRPKRFTSDSKYEEILFLLCKNGKLNLLKPLLEELDDKNLQDKDKYSLLHCAAEQGHISIVQYLFPFLNDKLPKTGSNKRLPSSDGAGTVRINKETPLHRAARNGHLDVIEYMLLHIDDGEINPEKSNGWTVLHDAAYFGHLNVVAFYTNKLDNPNPGRISKNKFRGRTPLHGAAQQGHLEVVKHFCNLLQDKNPRDHHGDTPLHRAAAAGHIAIVKYLVQFLYNKHPKSGSFKTPLDYAIDQDQTEVIDFLTKQ